VIKLTVQSYNAAPLPQKLSAQFNELGGTVGRADNNQLVLPDPERSISRVHAQVVFRNGAFAIVDRGSNPVLINGRPLGNGVEGPIKSGDQLQIGGYILVVEATAQSGASEGASDDPFADFGGMAFNAPSAPAPKPAAPASGFGAPVPLPMDAFGSPAGASSGGAFADLFGGGSSTPSGSSSPSAAGGIPDDWDPFAPDAPSSSSNDLSRSLGGGSNLGLEIGGAAPAPLIPDMGDLGGGKANTASSLDAMFGLSSSSDPLANSILAPASMAPNMSNHVDPMHSLNSVNQATATAAPDHVSALNQPFLEAPMQREPAAPPKGAVLSWDQTVATERSLIRPSPAVRSHVSPLAPAASPAPSTAPSTSPYQTFATPAAPAMSPATASSATPADQAALIQAFREGAGMPNLPLQALTPEFMHLLGQLLHEAAGGTVDLLVARQTLKKEVQAEMTMISTKGNNPLKFSPSAEVALNHLLNPPARGFMPAPLAMRDAYNDLRAHQVAFVAGVQSALEGVIKRFDPKTLESKLTQKSVLSSVLPGARKAKMWDVFIDLYGQISTEASEDFHELFGEEFRRTYDEHIKQLKRNG